MLALSFIYLLACSSLFFYFESGVNAHIAHFFDAVAWIVATLPFIGRAVPDPVSLGGFVVAVIAHFCGLIILSFWTACLLIRAYSIRP